MTSLAKIVTAADHLYFRTVWQLLKSYERHRPAGSVEWVLYDLGLTPDDCATLEARFPWCSIQTFDFGAYPDHVRVENGTYAWKPIIIADELSQTKIPLFWFDAGTILKKSWAKAIEQTHERGLWILRSQTALHRKCDAGVLKALSVPIEAWHMPEYAAGALGIDPANKVISALIEKWRDQALIASRINPPHSTVDHKHDQALLNCLLYKAAFEGAVELSTDEIDISSANPSSLISTRNFVSNDTPFLMDAAMRFWSSAWKFADRKYLKWFRRVDKFAGGLQRCIKEYFEVRVSDLANGITVKIPAPGTSYLADPFVVRRQTGAMLFAEEFRYIKDAGRLVVLSIDNKMQATNLRPLTFADPFSQISCHASFPSILEVDGVSYMVPETSERLSVDLYQCQLWPEHWQLRRRLLFGLDAADTMLIFHNEKWWLLTSVREGSNQRHLEIYFTDDLFRGQFRPHPINAQKLYSDKVHGTGRNGGRLAADKDGKLFRLIQSSAHHYGEGSELMEIITLNEKEFVEVPTKQDITMPEGLRPEEWHHRSTDGGWVAFDKRTRAR